MGLAHLTGVEGIVVQTNRIAYLIEEHLDLMSRFCLSRDRKIAHLGTRDCCIAFYSRIGGKLGNPDRQKYFRLIHIR